MPLATVTVAGTITAPDGTPFARKTVWFTTTAEMVDAAGNVLYPITRIQARVITGELKAADGTSPLVLVDSDAGLGTVPYVIEESWANGRKFTVNLTASMIVSGHIPYSTLGPVTPAPTAVGPYALLSDVETRDTATLSAAEAYTDAHSGGAVSSVFGRAGTVTAQTGDYTKAQVGLGNVDNTADSAKPVSTLQAAAISAAVNGLVNGAPGALDTLKELADALGDDASFATTITNALALKAPISTTTIDLIDRTNNTTETVPAGTTTNCSTAGVTKTAPALDNPVATPPKRFAVKNLSAGNITVAYPDQAGAAQSLVVLPAETRTFRQKTTSGWGVESGAIAVATLDARFAPTTGSTTYVPVVGQPPGLTLTDGQGLVWSTAAGGLVAANATGNSKLAYAENATGTAQTGIVNGSGSVDLTNMTITVPVTSRPVYLTASIGAVLTVGTGAPLLKIIETTSGGSTQIESSSMPIFATNQSARIVIPMFELATSVASTRTFKLQVFAPASGTPTVTVEHGTSGGRRSTFLAMAA